MKRSLLVRVGLIVAVGIPLIFVLYEMFLAATATSGETILFHTQIILAVIQGATVIFLAITVWLTYAMAVAAKQSTEIAEKSLQQMIEMREDDKAPYILVYFDIPYQSKIIDFVVKNVGNTPANRIRFLFDPPIKSTDDLFEHWIPIQHGIPSLGPNQEIRTYFDISPAYLNSQLPQIYTVKITYQGGLDGKQYEDNQTLDLSMYRGRTWTTKAESKNSMGEAAKSIAKSLQDIVEMLNKDSD